MVEVKGLDRRGRDGSAGDDDAGQDTGHHDAKTFSIGEVARRAGVAPSALRFYEADGLVVSERNAAGHRRYRADVLRRVAFIRVAQRVGLSLAEIRAALDSLPGGRTPSRRDWAELAADWQPMLDERIALLIAMRDKLDGCIGCGCLSLDTCAMYNPDDSAAERGTGPRYLLGDDPPA